MKGHILIVGAGVCGMTLGHKLVSAGYPVTIIEKQAEIGGLARTFRYDGFCFDSGPHRFFSSNPEVIRFLEAVFPDGLLTAPMKSSVHFLGRYYDWPLKPRVMLRLPPRFLVRVGLDFLISLRGRKGPIPGNFRDYVIRKYGRTLYDLDFGPYTEKFTKLPAAGIHPDWAKAGINRAAIAEDIKLNSLPDIIKTSLKPKPRVTIFYPDKGISEFHSRLSRSILQGGGVIRTRTAVASFVVENRTITEVVLEPDGSRLQCDTVVWTAPIDEAGDLLGVAPSDLEYLDIVIFNLSLRGAPKHDYQWVYFVDEDVVFNRLYNSVKFSPRTAPPGSYGLCVEVTCRKGAEVWQDPAAFYGKIIEDLRRVEFIDDRDEIVAIHHEKLEKAYPLYKMNYRQQLKERLDNLLRIQNLTLAGRTGLFWYNNMDHSIENAFAVAADVVRGRRSAESIQFWD